MIVRKGRAPADPEAEARAEHYGVHQRLRYSDAGGLAQTGAKPLPMPWYAATMRTGLNRKRSSAPRDHLQGGRG